ncbi:MAG: hypothetical protein AB1545_06830 [Thermodesulfobacteriota bacterium]
MGKLSKLRLKQPSKDRKDQEGVGEAELAVLSGGVLPGNGGNGGRQVEGKDGTHGPSVSRRRRKGGK